MKSISCKIRERNKQLLGSVPFLLLGFENSIYHTCTVQPLSHFIIYKIIIIVWKRYVIGEHEQVTIPVRTGIKDDKDDI